MDKVEVKKAGPADMDMLSQALEQLSKDLGDRHVASAATLAAACFGAHPGAHGFLAIRDNMPVGAALVSPVFSTTKGSLGAYVSDLWVAAGQRGRGTGKNLLREVSAFAAQYWGANFLKLTVYAANEPAHSFYERLGFVMAEQDRSLLLTGDGFEQLKGDA